jgi:hypothetical protein
MPPADNDAMNTEMRVRRALGLDSTAPRGNHSQSDPSRPRRRFVQDGEVPVVVVHGERRPDAHGGRIAELETALEAERTARAAAARALEEARATIHSLQTRLTHAELAHEEALAAEQRGRADAEAALLLARTEAAEAGLRKVIEAAPRPVTSARLLAVPKTPKAKAPPKEKRSRVVKWWSPAFKAAKQPG